MAQSEFVEIDVLRDPDGLGIVAPITRRQKPNGFMAFSFAIFKEFERTPGGVVQRTSYLNERHLGAVRKLLDMIEKRIAEEQDKMYASRRREQVRRCK